MFSKNQIRKIYKEKRATFTRDYISTATKKINQTLTETILKYATKNCIIGIYKAIENEINVDETIAHLKDRNIALPWIDYTEKIMHFKLWHHNDPLEKLENFYCLQPEKISQTVIPSIIITPLITCDLQGNRIGYGKGYYDKYLNQNSQKKILSIGVCYDKNIYPEIIPCEHHDHKLDMIISEERIIKVL
ncbi:MAG: 5-formyltetrahydrofolate cyclo-ligase [Rickettsiales bacterium]|nr:5-formyltetrahydrofolate cyclo-ligase [Rickettsiales bacterium]